MTSDNQRRGPWSRKEKDYIRDNYEREPADLIAKKLRRNVDAVRKYVETLNLTPEVVHAEGAETNLKKSPVWKDLERQFTKDELTMFLFHWRRILSQFREDVTPTEELQILDAIKLELLMNRLLSQQQAIVEELSAMQDELIDMQNGMADDREIARMRSKIADYRASQESMRRTYRELLEKKNDILKLMKGTRDQRLKVIESSKKNFAVWMKRIIEDRELRRQLGQDMEKMRHAMDVEFERLSQYHKYDDGEIDIPILTPENIPEDY